ncbi:hypothetical protein [Mycolicibacterium llatzerense]|uniref:hypothetical protein n=1 Tax=Mycolicibacterium llatzerense TaxID=280871 RepID=UPI0021B69598|nr:hypothetical protein [Mycolicibacterium llatzerense]MCT7373147.1 hypothetical protein [Mycolicibacterium llatzerense]
MTDEPDRELPDQFARIWERYQALADELRAHRAQMDAAWRHYQVTGAVWARVLSQARHGVLECGWRDNVGDAETAIRLYTDRPRSAEQSGRDAEALAVYEVAMTPAAAWEPYAAGGDWRRALAAWAGAMHELTRHQHRTKRWLSELGGTFNTRPTPGALAGVLITDAAALTRLDAVLEAREHDAIEASYRAGLAAGGEDEDWRSWYRARIRETWSASDDATYRLYYSVDRLLAALDSGNAWVTGADQITITEHLPDAWRRPPATHTVGG